MREIMFAGGVVPPVADTELLQSGQLWVTPFERAWLKNHICKRDCPEFRLWESGKKALAARVAVDRITATAALYFCGRVYYEEGCGLYLLVRYIDETYRSPLEKALLYLGEAGIGGQRNQGHGQFELQPSPNGEGYRWKKDFPAPVDAGVNSQLLLSLYHPTRKEVSAGVLNHAQYELLLRRGWIGSPDGSGVRRRGIRMLAEGAVFPDLDITGDIQDLKPKGFPHPVYRSGIAFTVPFARAA
jgi:CRISPR type III-A-associated RAMP protein Csm4